MDTYTEQCIERIAIALESIDETLKKVLEKAEEAESHD